MRRYRRSKIVSPLNLEKKTIMSILGVSTLAFSVLLVLSFFTQAGILLSLRESFYNLFGIGIVTVPLYGLIISLILFSIKSRFTKINIIFGSVGATISITGLVSIFSAPLAGVLGVTLFATIKSIVSPLGAFFVLSFTFLVSIIIASNTSLDQALTTISNFHKFVNTVFRNIKQRFFRVRQPKIIIKNQSEFPSRHSTQPKNLDTGLEGNSD